MLLTGLVNLYTGDIEAGVRFYRDLLDFVETFRTPLEGIPEHVEFALGGFKIGLGTVEAAERVHGVRPELGRPAMVLVIWADDVDAAFARLVAADVPVVQQPHRHRQPQPERPAARSRWQPRGDRLQAIARQLLTACAVWSLSPSQTGGAA